MLSFLEFIIEGTSDNLVGSVRSEKKGSRHVANYIAPYLNKAQRKSLANNFKQHMKPGKIDISVDGEHYDPDPEKTTHELSSAANGHPAGTAVRVTGARHDDQGKIFVQTAKHGEVQASKLRKPAGTRKAQITKTGFDTESKIAKNLGGEAAGSTGTAYDFTYNKGKKGEVRGKVKKLEIGGGTPLVRGEVKTRTTSIPNLGVSSLKFDKNTRKWGFTNKKMAKHFSKATHPVSGLPLLDHLDKHHSNGVIENGFAARAATGTAAAYIRGAGVNALHLHRTEPATATKERINHGTTYTVGPELQGATRLGHLHPRDINKFDGVVNVESTTTGSTRAAHRPSVTTFKKAASRSVTDPENHRDLSREDHANEFMKHVDKLSGGK